MTAYLDLNEKLDETGIQYDKLSSEYRSSAFPHHSISYITLYLSIVFLVVANFSSDGVQFLMSQQKTSFSQIADFFPDLPGSFLQGHTPLSEKQIPGLWDFPVYWLRLSAVFSGVRAFFTGILSSPVGPCMDCWFYLSAFLIGRYYRDLRAVGQGI